MPRFVVIDTDPGIDDAVAILLALRSAEFDIRGITTVAGNIGIATTTRNAGRILALAGRSDIPVVTGAAAPLSRKGFDVADIHGADGLGGVAFPEPAAIAASGAAEWLARLLDENEVGAIDILALGPLTNIARLVLDRPASARRIGRIIAMGGAVREPGNIGPRSEFNMAADPEAAAIVLRARLALTLVPLDVTRKVRASPADTAVLKAAGNPAALASGELIEAYFQQGSGRESRPLHDPCVMLQAIEPCLFGIETLKLTVDTGGGPDAGALNIDDRDGAPVDVAMTTDAAGSLRLLLERLTTR
jgi:purine nucleosidase/pyrimidine-specific ribonucleoside hydrolase